MQLVECLLQVERHVTFGDRGIWLRGILVLDEIGNVRVAVPHADVQGDWVVDDVEQGGHLFEPKAGRRRQFFGRRGTSELLPQPSFGLTDSLEVVDDMDGQANRPSLIGDRATDGLLDPPGCVRGQFEALGVVEFLDSAHQADVALLDQVEQWHARGCAVGTRNRHHEPKVALDELLLGAHVPRVLAAGQGGLFTSAQ